MVFYVMKKREGNTGTDYRCAQLSHTELQQELLTSKKHSVHSHCATFFGRLQGTAAGGTDKHTTLC